MSIVKAGFVVANDFDVKRSYLLIHQVQRLRELYPYAILTNHDACHYPYLDDKSGVQTFSPSLSLSLSVSYTHSQVFGV